MTVNVQSNNLSSLSPKLMLYNSSLGLVGTALAPNSMGATVTVSTAVKAGQGYYVKVLAAPGYGAIGSYGLLINAGPLSQAPIPPPNTVVLQQPDGGGTGSLTNAVGAGNNTGALPPTAVYTTIGTFGGWAEVLTIAPSAPSASVTPPVDTPASPVPASPIPVAPVAITVAPAPSPLAVAPVTPTKHHPGKPKHVKMPRFAVGHRIKLVNDHAKPKHRHR